MYISLNDFLRALLMLSAIAAMIALTVVLWHLSGIVKRVGQALDDNRQNIDTTLATLPGTLKNINDVMSDVKTITGKAGNVVGNVDQAVTGAVSRAGDTAGNIIEIAKAVGESVKYIAGMFGKKAAKKEHEGQ
ncbi:MAG TPA: hypothetical protein PLT03_02665 [Bacillota bacterium]|nr:hypothetical protein [Bacillota bacterium]